MTLAVVLGRAIEVWDELKALEAMRKPDIVVAVNVVGQEYAGDIHHWVSFHAELLPVWLANRRAKGYPEPGKFWTAIHRGKKLGKGVDLPLNHYDCNGGSSGLLGARVAASVADKVVLCGIPMENHTRIDDATLWKEAGIYKAVWPTYKDELKHVRSMSGWTEQFLGAPTEEWLNAPDNEGDQRPEAN